MGALRRTLTVKQSKILPMMISPWLHAGVIHLIVNLSSIVLVGHRMEQEFGSCKYLQYFHCLTSSLLDDNKPTSLVLAVCA